jgi:lipopolysaccharide export system protein LptA
LTQLAQAQVDTIRCQRSESLVGSLSNGVAYNRLLGNVQLEQNGTVLTCDSAHLYLEINFVECFGNVHIAANNGATVAADYIKYTGSTTKAYLKGNVQIVDGNNTITSDELDYNLRTKIATYNKSATLVSDGTTLNSTSGTYNGKTKDAEFRGDVTVNNEKYDVNSEHLKYNTEREFVTFLASSTIITEDATIVGKRGTYDAKKQEGKFDTRSTVLSDEQEITANKLYYNKVSGMQKADGNVNLFDNKERRRLLCEHLTYNSQTTQLNVNGDVQIDEFANARILVCEYAQYNKRNAYMKAMKRVVVYDSAEASILQCDTVQYNFERNLSLATGKPLLRMLADKDSMFIRATAFFGAPAEALDTIKHFVVPSNIVADSTKERNTDVKRIVIGKEDVRLFTDSMQALCDSLVYSQKDSVFKLFKQPILWANGSQATADTIYLQTQNNKARHIKLIQNAFVINDTKATGLYDQITGRTIDGDIVNDNLDELFVEGNAQTIYYNKNDKGEYEGMNKAEASQLRIRMKDKKVNRISFYSLPKGTMTPMDLLTADAKQLEGFKWQESRRPKTKEDVIGVAK